MFKKYRFIQIVLLITIGFTMAACVEKTTLTIVNRTSITQNISGIVSHDDRFRLCYQRSPPFHGK